MSGYLVMSTWAMLVLVAAHSINADAVGKTDEAKPESRKMELIKAAENPVKSFYKCYECLAGSTSPCKSGSCTGASCIKVEASQGSDHAYTAGCSAMSVSSGCNTKNIAGIDTTICYCNSDMCNKAGKLEFSLLSFLVLLIAGAFGVMLT